MTNLASKDDFFKSANKRRFKDVALPSGLATRIRSLTAGEWADIDMGNVNKIKGGINPAGVRNSDFRLIAAAVVDGAGNPIFSATDIPQLESMDAADAIALARLIKEHTGIRQDVEDAIKNFGTTGAGDSTTSSSSGQGRQDSTASS